MKKLIAPILILLLLFLIIRGWWGGQMAAVDSSDKQIKTVIIPKGTSVAQIGEQLKKENLIRSTFVFSLYVRQQGLADKIQAGTFKLSPSMTTVEIIESLRGGAAEIWVTLLEGWRLEEMGEELGEQLGIKSDEFIKKGKEGYMFPDTYLFPREITVDQIVKTLRSNFESKYDENLRKKIRAKGLTDEEGVILASIVEREARSQKVRTEVASILLKRINIDMGINADATIQYSLGHQSSEKSWWKRHLTRDDLKLDSDYNTYLYKGLPPTPICNPSLSSLQAVANADPKTPYLYYYHDSKGNSYYGTTLEEHNENVANNP